MKFLKNILLILTAVLILVPSAVSLSHIFTDHDHKLCDNYAEHHYHAKSLDCDLYHFHKTPALSFNFPLFSLVVVEIEAESIFDYYRFLNEFEPLYFDLRGPPFFA